MCGVAGFLSNQTWRDAVDLSWLTAACAAVEQVSATDPAAMATALDALAARFGDLMAFGTHAALLADAGLRQQVTAAATGLERLEQAVRQGPQAREPAQERLAERLRDYAWQLRHELVDNLDRCQALLAAVDGPVRPQQFVAWGIEQVLENLDRLEVRGRDSAGIAVQIHLERLDDTDAAAIGARIADGRGGFDRDGSVVLHRLADGGATVRFAYKTAQLIGRLGDNGAAIRARIAGDRLLWSVAAQAAALTALAHTRWASHGAITLPNCHPLNGRLAGDNAPALSGDADTMAVLNGDVDNYRGLKEALVEASGQAIEAEVTTDAKIIPVVFRLIPGPGTAERVLSTLRRLEGSVAIALMHPEEPGRLHLGQKGSGQSLFVASVADGLILASENYGLAPRARASVPLAKVEQGGLSVVLSTRPGEPALSARTIDDGAPATLKAESIEIFSRDIFRGAFEHFFEKEVHESADSVRKTLVGRYRRQGRRVDFQTAEAGEAGLWAALRGRLTDPGRPAVRRIYVTGQGTAAIAGTGIAHLLRQALAGTAIHVEAAKASELSSDLEGRRLEDTLVIAISQSGTTTDTNRTVDLARAAGAWIHAIVNRRNSPLVRKADSHLFTSDGRDIEMAVASTKAFYSQVAAGKLTALCMADVLGTLSPGQIQEELVALEGLPARIREVLADEASIAACAERYAPCNRYWAVVGNGPNKIAAEEIRIKLSELCYKSIPVDYTEDKKHIDLSTEPLTLVVANDLPPALAQDTAKEVAIFKAHAGKPIVIAAKGETCFDSYAEAVIRVPSAGAGLDFVLATVAGHLWGFHAARAIDRRSAPFKAMGVALEQMLVAAGKDGPVDGLVDSAACAGLAGQVEAELVRIAAGELDAALPPRAVAGLARLGQALRGGGSLTPAEQTELLTAGPGLLRTLFEETSRPIDTIRHQAKTVTVGISRPGRELSPLLLAVLADLGIAPAALAEHDRQTLLALSPVLTAVPSGMLYHVRGDGVETLLQAGPRSGQAVGVPSGYDRAKPAAGSKRRALRLGRAVLSSGPQGRENLLLLPIFAGADWTLQGLALLHVELLAQASLQQKAALLKELRLYEDLVDAYNEAVHGEARDVMAFIAAQSPRDLVFAAPQELLRGVL